MYATFTLSLQEKADLLTDAQWKTLGYWSCRYGKTIPEMMADLRPDIWNEEVVGFAGMLPCGLYGLLHRDGSSHT